MGKHFEGGYPKSNHKISTNFLNISIAMETLNAGKFGHPAIGASQHLESILYNCAKLFRHSG